MKNCDEKLLNILNELKKYAEDDLNDENKNLAAHCLIDSINTRISMIKESNESFSIQEILESIIYVLNLDCKDDTFDSNFVKTTIDYIDKIKEFERG